MKNFFGNFLRYFFNSPVLPFSAVICAVMVVFVTADSPLPQQDNTSAYTITVTPFFLGESLPETTMSSSGTTTATSTLLSGTTTGSETTAAVTTVTTEAADESNDISPEEPVYEEKYAYLSAGDSPNSGFYQDRLVIIGDSVAYGFNAYGYIPDQHNIAKESLALWNMGNYSFDLGGGDMGLLDAAVYADSSLYYISIGLNDIYTYSPGDYAWNIRWLAEDLLSRVPDTTIVIGAITPVSNGNYYTDNGTIDEFNAALEAVVNDLGSGRILFFDANAALKDLSTGALSQDYAGGDGLHLGSSAYSRVLSCLFNFLDSTEAVNQIY